MKILSQNALNPITIDISVLPLNLQDHLVLFGGRVVGMFHKAHKVARMLSLEVNNNQAVNWLIDEGFKVQFTAEPFVLAQWYDSATAGCGEIIHRIINEDK